MIFIFHSLKAHDMYISFIVQSDYSKEKKLLIFNFQVSLYSIKRYKGFFFFKSTVLCKMSNVNIKIIKKTL